MAKRQGNEKTILIQRIILGEKVWLEDDLKYVDSYSEIDPEEADYARVLRLINEFLPVGELVGRVIDVSVLRQFGLVENDQLDTLLAAALVQSQSRSEGPASESKPAGDKIKLSQPAQAQQ